jgi:hypothetical protein
VSTGLGAGMLGTGRGSDTTVGTGFVAGSSGLSTGFSRSTARIVGSTSVPFEAGRVRRFFAPSSWSADERDELVDVLAMESDS